MINLRYHIVSLTAVFLAIGIGLTLGSTFLDRATVDNLNGQLTSLEGRLADRESRIGELEDAVDADEEVRAALDDQAIDLLDGRLTGVPVVVVAARGVEESDVRGSVQALVVAGADLQGLWWITDRWLLDDESEIDDVAELLGETSDDPSRLRRMAIAALGGELRARQLLEPDATAEAAGEDAAVTTSAPAVAPGAPDPGAASGEASPEQGSDAESAPTSTAPASDPDAPIDILDALVADGFIDFEPIPGGPEAPRFPTGTRMLVIGGSRTVPDDLVLEPLVERMGRATTTPVLAVAASAVVGEGAVSDLVAVIRQDEVLREVVSTVDQVEHFDGWAAMVVALADLRDGVVGHYGLTDGASRLLPPLRTP